MKVIATSLLLIIGCTLLTPAAASNGATAILEKLTDGDHFALLRHALAPGTGDPAHFDVTDCATQRNLNDVGRMQAANIGDALRDAGLIEATVYSSQWCRCLETARLLDIGPVQELESLNSFFQARQNQDRQMRELRQWMSEQLLELPVVLVTHQVNITALTGNFAASGELVIVKRLGNSEFQVVGTVKTDT